MVVVMQPHLSATLLMAGITVAMLFVGGAKIQHLIGVGVTGLAGIAALVVTMWGFFSDRFAHVLVRLSYWLDPFSSMDWGSYQTRQSLLAIGSGGLLGVGLGESRQKPAVFAGGQMTSYLRLSARSWDLSERASSFCCLPC